jgi:alpha-ketoglutarate-dependent taurine dioxygenase
MAMLSERIEGPRAWTARSIAVDDWNLPISAAAIAELGEFVRESSRNPLPMLLLDPDDYALDAVRMLTLEVRRRLEEGCGVVLLDRLPADMIADQDLAARVFWLFGTLVGRPVVQTIDGQVMVEVTDTGVKKTIGVRGFRTNVEQRAHIDNSFNHTPPDYVSLLSLRQAKQGGLSRFISFYSVHNRLLAEHHDLLERLYRPFYQDRQGDFWPDEPQTVFYPVFSDEAGGLRCRYTHFTIPAGYETAGEPLDDVGRDSFAAMTRIIDDPAMYCEFMIEPGQIQIVNNKWCGHGRTGYVDASEARKRLLLRLWHREHGRRTYTG